MFIFFFITGVLGGMTGFLTSYDICSFVALDGGNHLVVQFLGMFLSSSS